MNNTVKSEKYRKLSITALVTGILAAILAVFWWFGWLPIVLQVSSSPLAFGLSITAVVCGSIDLKRIRAGLYSKKGKGFDITGIVLGGPPILFALYSGIEGTIRELSL